MTDGQDVINGADAPNQEQRQWAMFAHLSAIIFGFLGPLVVWLMKKDEMPFVDAQGKEALNFQITVLIAYVVSMILMFVLIGIFLFFIVWIGSLVLAIIGGIKANNGVAYRYPVALRLIK